MYPNTAQLKSISLPKIGEKGKILGAVCPSATLKCLKCVYCLPKGLGRRCLTPVTPALHLYWVSSECQGDSFFSVSVDEWH